MHLNAIWTAVLLTAGDGQNIKMFTDLHQTCHKVQSQDTRDVLTSVFLVEIRSICVRQTGSGIKCHRCCYEKITLMSNIWNTDLMYSRTQ